MWGFVLETTIVLEPKKKDLESVRDGEQDSATRYVQFLSCKYSSVPMYVYKKKKKKGE